MIVSHLVTSIDIGNGGPSRSVTHLLSELGKIGQANEYKLHTGISPNPIQKEFEYSNVQINFHPPNNRYFFKDLNSVISSYSPNIIHLHGIWNLPIHQLAVKARKMDIPYIISPRGMLNNWSLKQRRIKKQVALSLYQMRDLKSAFCLHATAEDEAESIRSLGISNPIAIIPNGIPLDFFPVKSEQHKEKVLLFLSRIHPKKGIENLIEAWVNIPNEITKEWKLRIIGNGDFNYVSKLRQAVLQRGQDRQITIEEPLFGAEKIKAYHEASLFVLPTYSENFGIVVAESLACGTPVITTQGAPWEDLNNSNSGRWIGLGAQSLINTLEEMLCKDPKDLFEMGQNGRKLVEDKYSIRSVAQRFSEMYSWINGDEQPSFIHFK